MRSFTFAAINSMNARDNWPTSFLTRAFRETSFACAKSYKIGNKKSHVVGVENVFFNELVVAVVAMDSARALRTSWPFIIRSELTHMLVEEL